MKGIKQIVLTHLRTFPPAQGEQTKSLGYVVLLNVYQICSIRGVVYSEWLQVPGA